MPSCMLVVDCKQLLCLSELHASSPYSPSLLCVSSRDATQSVLSKYTHTDYACQIFKPASTRVSMFAFGGMSKKWAMRLHQTLMRHPPSLSRIALVNRKTLSVASCVAA